jgi:hypothetical protein
MAKLHPEISPSLRQLKIPGIVTNYVATITDTTMKKSRSG